MIGAEDGLIDYLRQKTKGKLLMSPEQLSDEIGITPKQQSKLRKENRFPIPYKNIGRLVYYSIYDVANFLLNGESEPVAPPPEAPKVEVPKARKTPSRPVTDLSHIFILRAFAQSLEARATAMLQLSEQLKRYANSKELTDKISAKLPLKNSSVIDGKI